MSLTERDPQELFLPNTPTREQIDLLESHMLAMDQVIIEPIHHFADGLYAREISIPAGTILTGKVHTTEHLNIVSSGRIAVWTEDGVKIVCAPCTILSLPGTKRVGYALEDTVWTTIHKNPSNTTDLAVLEADLISDAAPALATKEIPCLG